MNFFEQQERARKNTVVLIILFILCALCISTAVAYPLCLYFLDGMHLRDSFSPTYVFAHVPLSVLLTLFLCPLAFMTYKSIQKIRELSKGSGEYVIRSLHGRLISRYGAGTKETALLNVAEEIAVAFGIPPPPVYILDADYKINAFAAGFTYDDAVIGVTAGAIEHLTRQELQGVIAHEFSHILNGDMKLNTFAVGILNGILAVELAGENAIKKSLGSNSRGKAGDRLGGVIAGIILYTIGYVGLFFGNLIKAAINRERE
ncbi:MAG: M48 family metalloprotease, partial [Deferribacteraceae bacterium]|nr:M48 family metalloprotease [Deferribacteraceae bacterium]